MILAARRTPLLHTLRLAALATKSATESQSDGQSRPFRQHCSIRSKSRSAAGSKYRSERGSANSAENRSEARSRRGSTFNLSASSVHNLPNSCGSRSRKRTSSPYISAMSRSGRKETARSRKAFASLWPHHSVRTVTTTSPATINPMHVYANSKNTRGLRAFGGRAEYTKGRVSGSSALRAGEEKACFPGACGALRPWQRSCALRAKSKGAGRRYFASLRIPICR